jgi:hypothetical protein
MSKRHADDDQSTAATMETNASKAMRTGGGEDPLAVPATLFYWYAYNAVA